MAGYGKVRQLVTGDSGMDTFIREVRTSLGELHDATAGASTSSRVVPWDINHKLAYSFANQAGTTFIRNEGSAGQSYGVTVGGTIPPRFGFPSPFSGAVEFASESTTASSLIYGSGSYPVAANNYSLECMLFTHFFPYDVTAGDSYAPLWKSNYVGFSIPVKTLSGGIYVPPTTIDVYMTLTSGAFTVYPAQSVTFPTGQWNHIMFTASSTTGKKLYLNGQLIASVANNADTVTNTNDWTFGAGSSGGLWKFYGAMARFAYSTVARPQSYAIQVTNAMRGW